MMELPHCCNKREEQVEGSKNGVEGEGGKAKRILICCYEAKKKEGKKERKVILKRGGRCVKGGKGFLFLFKEASYWLKI